MDYKPDKKIYFVSDCHFGIPDREKSLVREKLLVKWLEEIKHNTEELYILGDLFDYWFEYKSVVPRGYSRLFGKLSEIADSGIKIYYFTGNHDMWMFGYLEQELGLQIIRQPVEKNIRGKEFYIGHGDGLGPGDYGYKFLKKIFKCRLCQWLFARLHPNFATAIGWHVSRRSRLSRGDTDQIYRGDEGEYLLIYSKEKLKEKHFDFFVFGHRHLPLDIPLSENSRYINTGDWFYNFTYGEFDGKEFYLKKYQPES